MEHRCGRRLALSLMVRVWDSNGPVHVARLTDISLTGAFLQLAVPLPPMTAVVVELKWPTALSRGSVRVAGFVARQSSAGSGIEWDEFAPAGALTVMREFLSEPRSERFAEEAQSWERRLPLSR